MNKEEFLNLLNNAKEDEYGNLYYIDTHLDINNRVYFGTITTICEDLIEVFASKEKEGYELYDRHFWNDDTLECKIVHTKGNDYEKENQELKKQLEYLRSGEYLNQLKFERNLLEDIVATAKVSKEDKEFIDMTHRNTELLEETQVSKQTINELSNKIAKLVEEKKYLEKQNVDLQQRINEAIHRIQLLQMDNEVTVRDLGLIARDLKGEVNEI